MSAAERIRILKVKEAIEKDPAYAKNLNIEYAVKIKNKNISQKHKGGT